VLAMSGGLGASTGQTVVFAQEMKQGCVAQGQSFVGFALFVNEQRKTDLCVFAELARVSCVSQADGHQLGALLSESFLVLTQLRDVLAAEDSTVMAKEDNCRQTAGPQAAELYGPAIQIRQGDSRQLARVCFRHGDILRA